MKYAAITNISYYFPEKVEDNVDARLIRKTGIESRHIASSDETAADLAVCAVRKLFNQGVDPSHIDFLLFCTQSPDYFLPTTACVLQARLGLSSSCGALDYNLGCSGYIYGVSLAKGLIETGQVSNVLLITAETYSKYINAEDHAVRPLFGDAASATLIQGVDAEQNTLKGFVFGTDGKGKENLIVKAGGARYPSRMTEEVYSVDAYGNRHTNFELSMNGYNIMQFSAKVVPEALERILSKTHLLKENIDYYVFHQANKFMLEFLKEKCDLGEKPFWNDVSKYGNTVSNSIPIALADLVQTCDKNRLANVVTIGFGVGLSWAGCVIDLRFMNVISGD